MSSSPKPTAHRAFTVLLAFLLVGSVLAPIGAAQPAAAQTDGEGCAYESVNWWIFECSKQTSPKYIDTDQAANETSIDLHVQSQSVWEDWEMLSVNVDNYLTDSETVASLEAKNAIADAYENNMSATEADAAAQEAIQDYYTVRQKNIVNEWSAQNAQLAYVGDVAFNDSEISNNMLGRVIHNTDAPGIARGAQYDGSTKNFSISYINGTTENYTSAGIEFEAENDMGGASTFWYYPVIDQIDENTTDITVSKSEPNLIEDGSGADLTQVTISSQTWVEQPYAGSSLGAQKVFDEHGWYEKFTAIEEQAQTMQDNYPDGFAEDVYAKLDSGQLTTSELRGAEGMARYLSGDSNVTDQRFMQANVALLGLDRPMSGNASSMVIEFSGATEKGLNSTSNATEVEYSGYVDGATYEGLLYANAPESGFEVGSEYSTSALNGSPVIATNDGEIVSLYDGDFTIKEMYDTDGNSVEQTNWNRPRYDTYDADAFVQSMENASRERAIIVGERGDGDGDTTISIDDPFSDIGAGAAIAGLVIIVAAVGVVASIVLRRP